jgi:hypothetical protein
MPSAAPKIGVINGDTSIAPIMTAVLLAISPNDAIMEAVISNTKKRPRAVEPWETSLAI